MRDKKEKTKIKLQLFRTLFIDIIFLTLLIGTVIYFGIEYLFNNTNISFYASLLYSFSISLFIEWLFIRKYIDTIKLDLEVIDLNNELNYVDINKFLEKNINKITSEINHIKRKTYKENPKKFSIPLNLNINSVFMKIGILETLKNILNIDEQEIIKVDIDEIFNFLCKYNELIESIKKNNKLDASRIRKEEKDDSWMGGYLASNDEHMQIMINYIESLKHKFISIIIQEYTNQSTFSPVTSEYYSQLIKYINYCSIKDKLDFNNDIFEIIANNMEINYRDDYKKNVLLFQLYKLFEDKELVEFKQIIIENYLYLLSRNRTKPKYFLDMLFNDSLINHSNLEFLYEVRKRFSKFLFKKEYELNIINGYSFWPSMFTKD